MRSNTEISPHQAGQTVVQVNSANGVSVTPIRSGTFAHTHKPLSLPVPVSACDRRGDVRLRERGYGPNYARGVRRDRFSTCGCAARYRRWAHMYRSLSACTHAPSTPTPAHAALPALAHPSRLTCAELDSAPSWAADRLHESTCRRA